MSVFGQTSGNKHCMVSLKIFQIVQPKFCQRWAIPWKSHSNNQLGVWLKQFKCKKKFLLWSGQTLKWCFPNQRIMLLFNSMSTTGQKINIAVSQSLFNFYSNIRALTMVSRCSLELSMGVLLWMTYIINDGYCGSLFISL